MIHYTKQERVEAVRRKMKKLCPVCWQDTVILVVVMTIALDMGLLLQPVGADDYITKPFGGGELLARIRAALRHARNQVAGPSYTQTGVYRAGELCIDFDRHLVQLEGQDVHLTQSEYKIVSLLTRYAGKVLTYDFIIREIWGEKATGDTQNLRANMAKIRRKLEKNPGKPQYIFTEVGVGYRMAE